MPRQARPKRTFGHVEQVKPSNRYRARFTGPDAGRYSSPGTFDSYGDAEAWLIRERQVIERDPENWLPPRQRIRASQQRLKLAEVTFAEYAASWLATRKSRGRPLAIRTQEHYQSMLTRLLLPTFGDVALTAITPESILAWYETCRTPEGQLLATREKLRADAYVLFKSILTSAADPAQTGGARIPFNPAAIRGAGSAQRQSRTVIATPRELQAVAEAMPEQYRLLVLLAGWCGLRSGEVRELRRDDVDTAAGVLHVRRQVVRTKTGMQVTGPKTTAGDREVIIPPSLLPDVRRHLLELAQPGADGLLFPSVHAIQLAPVVLSEMFDRARRAAGRPNLRFHDLRHTALTYAAQTGATIAELQSIAGHTTPQAALRYQHATQDRKRLIADSMDAMRRSATGDQPG